MWLGRHNKASFGKNTCKLMVMDVMIYTHIHKTNQQYTGLYLLELISCFGIEELSYPFLLRLI
jgi:hypothetical protein